LQLATISSIAVSFDLKLIEKSSGSNQDKSCRSFLHPLRLRGGIGAHPRLDGGTDRGDYKEAAMTTA
jgi:hypothetical protein